MRHTPSSRPWRGWTALNARGWRRGSLFAPPATTSGTLPWRTWLEGAWHYRHMPFDLLDWYRFRPATEMCQNCRAIYLPLIPIDERENLRWKIQRGLVKECRVCGVVIAREDQGDLVMKRQKEQAANLRELAAVAESLPPHTDPEALTVE